MNELYKELKIKFDVEYWSDIEGFRKCNICGKKYKVRYCDLKRGTGLTDNRRCGAILKHKRLNHKINLRQYETA